MIIGFDASRAFIPQRTGTENYSFELLKSLAKIDNKNQYIVYTRNNFATSKTNTDWPSNFNFKEIPLKRFWTQIGLAYRTWIDKLDILFVPAHTLPVLIKPKLQTLVTIHDLGYEYLPQYHKYPHKIYLNWSTIYAVKQASKIIAVSEATKKDLINKLCCLSDKIEVIYEGVDKDKWKATISPEQTLKILKKYNLVNRYLLSVGTIQPRKNYFRLIEAFAKLNYTEIDLVIIGKKGWLWQNIIELPNKIGIEKRVKFLEYVPDIDLPILYQKALCLVIPSLYEGFGLPVLEAMAAQCPVIASNISSLPEIVSDAGILIDPYNINSIIESIKTIISSPQKRNELVIKGTDRIKDFSWSKTAERTLALFTTVNDNNE